MNFPEGNAIVYCEGNFGNLNGKTAHGLVRMTKRYKVLSVVDSTLSGKDAGEFLDNKPNNIPILDSVEHSYNFSKNNGVIPTHLVMGIAPDGGRLPDYAYNDIKKAITLGLNIDSGLHDFISEYEELANLAKKHDVKIRDIRKTPDRSKLHSFSGNIENVKALKIAILGTDSAVGKRTTAWILVNAFNKAGLKTEMIGTGQTGWLQGAEYSIIMDSLINDFVAGELENAILSAYKEKKCDVIIIEGQGSLMNPAYPGGFEILAAGRPDVVILQHSPSRKEYDGFAGYKIHPLSKQIEAIELISGKKVVAITINHENLTKEDILRNCDDITKSISLPCYDVLLDGGDNLVRDILDIVNKK
ncbi:MAG: hypothetical protein A2086_08835 [Spirochaetes bacterium GWD1_27_9]|nr:MAG: hypothetical protein A2Z98_16355 [Spirochaetes bacterium GWB1_27_13]OHD20481.1 MAG: hypothetical protein A2Y34_03585 [Spirochaetes bacterium GWC1_27_15]OHD30736.1 MAG: hypothetical protein A2086_08835 [Spirochaetes bacterium GWD1_27_9]